MLEPARKKGDSLSQKTILGRDRRVANDLSQSRKFQIFAKDITFLAMYLVSHHLFTIPPFLISNNSSFYLANCFTGHLAILAETKTLPFLKSCFLNFSLSPSIVYLASTCDL